MRRWIAVCSVAMGMGLATAATAASLNCQGVDEELSFSLPITGEVVELEVHLPEATEVFQVTPDINADGIGGAAGDGVLIYTEQAADEVRGEIVGPDFASRIVCEKQD